MRLTAIRPPVWAEVALEKMAFDEKEGILSQEILEAAREDAVRLFLVLGGVDTGKTTFTQKLAGELAKDKEVAVVDADPGQSDIGPPTTIAWGHFPSGEAGKNFRTGPGPYEWGRAGWEDIKAQAIYFVGSTSPAGHLLPTITGTKLTSDAALHKADKVIVDTSGLISGGPGEALKRHKIDILRPDMIVALERERELEYVARHCKGRKGMVLYRLPEVPGVKVKSALERAEHRRERFREYFKEARCLCLNLEEVSLVKEEWLNLSRLPLGTLRAPSGSEGRLSWEGQILNRLVSLRDEDGWDKALGIIEGADEKTGSLTIYSPVNPEVKVVSIIPGRLRLTRAGEEL